MKPSMLFFPLLLSGMILLSVIFLKQWKKPPEDIIWTQRAVLSAEAAVPAPQPSMGLADAVQATMTGTQGTYGIVVKNLKTKESFFLDEHRVFETASIYKLWIMAAAFKQIEDGQLNEDDVLSGETVDYTVREALLQMITVSDNYAALLLTDKVGLDAIGAFLQDNGLSESKTGVGRKSPITTAWDTAIFLEKLYNGQLGNPESTKGMIDLLKWQKLNESLPKYLPEGVVVAHKTGEIDSLNHDAGIVFTDKGDYLIVIFTDTDSRPLAREMIAEVSKTVYNYFSSLGTPAK